MPALVGGGLQGAAGRDQPRASRRAVPRRAARIPAQPCSIRCASRSRPAVVSVARANSHVTFPARVQLVAAMNPCRCGHLGDPALACSRAPRCAADYQAKVSGPLLDRIDLHVDVQGVSAADLEPAAAGRRQRRSRRAGRGRARRPVGALQRARRAHQRRGRRRIARPRSRRPTSRAASCSPTPRRRCGFSARGFHRVLRVARTIADLAGSGEGRADPRRRGAQLPPPAAAQLSELAR